GGPLLQVACHVTLVGFMGCGKSTAGPLVAEYLRVPFVDLDALVEARTAKRIATIFAEEGEPAFRAEESAALQEVLTRSPHVIATGGGIVTTPANWALLLEHTLTVWL